MDDAVLELFEQFAARRARGERPDPIGYLALAGPGAGDLQRLIDGLLTSAPPPPPDPATLESMRALVAGEPALLELRLGRAMRVDEVVSGLVSQLRLGAGRADKVKRLYQQLEAGLLDPSRLDRRLIRALSRTLGVPERDLPLGGPPPSPTPLPAYARGAATTAAAEWSVQLEDAGPPDEVDRLFGVE